MVAVLPEQLGGVEVAFRIGKGSTESRPTIPGMGLCLHRGGMWWMMGIVRDAGDVAPAGDREKVF